MECITLEVRIDFINEVRTEGPKERHNSRASTAKMKLIEAETKKLVEKGVISEITRKEAERAPGFYSNMGTVSKRDPKKHRAILNLKRLNEHIEKETFMMETVWKVKEVLVRDGFAATIDIEDAFYHVNVREEDTKYLRFMIHGRIYEYMSMPMGLTSSPRLFTRLVRFLSGVFRKSGIIHLIYLDDILVTAETKEECREQTAQVLRTLRKLGFAINEAKSVTEPSQKVLYLGCWWDLRKWMVYLSKERYEKLRGAAESLRKNPRATHRQVARFLGMAQSAVVAVPLAKARCRQVQWEHIAECEDEDDWEKTVFLSKEAKEELLFWERLKEVGEQILIPHSGQTLDTDAAQSGGLGAYFNGVLYSEKDESEDHINIKELKALDWAIDRLRKELKPGRLTWRVDNSAAEGAIRNQGSTVSWELNWLAVDILHKAKRLNVHIEPIHLSSADNYLADGASRSRRIADWSLDQRAADEVFERFGTPDVDLMASAGSRKVQRFYSWDKRDKEAEGLDSLAGDVIWSEWRLPYIFPPFSLIPGVLRKMKEQKVRRAILIAPWRTRDPVHPVLMKMSKRTMRIPHEEGLVMDLESGVEAPHTGPWNLVAYEISGRKEEEDNSSWKKRRLE